MLLPHAELTFCVAAPSSEQLRFHMEVLWISYLITTLLSPGPNSRSMEWSIPTCTTNWVRYAIIRFSRGYTRGDRGRGWGKYWTILPAAERWVSSLSVGKLILMISGMLWREWKIHPCPSKQHMKRKKSCPPGFQNWGVSLTLILRTKSGSDLSL